MRRPGSIEAMAALENERAKNRGAIARRLVGEMRPWRGTLVSAFGFVLVLG